MSSENENISLKDGRVILYRRNDCGGAFHCRLRIRGHKGYVRKALGTKDEKEAISLSEQLYEELKYKLERGLSISARKFNVVCDEYLKELVHYVRIGKAKEKKLQDYRLISERYLKNYFGKKDIDKIAEKEIEKYRVWRNEYWITGEGAKLEYIEYERNGKTVKMKARHKIPSSSTLNSEETVLRQIFEFAVRRQYLSHIQLPEIKSQKVVSNRRPAFTIQEYKKLRNKSLSRCKKAPTEKIRRQRLLLHDFILIMANSGTRPIEAMTLRWRDISNHVSPQTGERHTVLSVRGKSKRRDLIAQRSTWKYFERIKERQEQYAEEHGYKIEKDDYIFVDEFKNKIASFKSGFDVLLDEADLTEDNHGLKRTIYSLRHMYATFRLIYGCKSSK